MSSFKTLDQADLAGRRVLVRVDINVPIAEGVVTDATRIRAVVPTVRDILDKGGRPILLAHMGRPKGKFDASQSLAPLTKPLADALGCPVVFAGDNPEWSDRQLADGLEAGQVLLLENVRFHPGEEKNDIELARDWAGLGDLYVNDAFSVSHRAHASTEAIAHVLPAYAGRSMQAELEALERVLANPERPVVAVIGGAKVSTKLDLIGNLIGKVDSVVIGGGMANTFLAARGAPVGTSLCEHDLLDTARRIEADARACGCAILLPVDVVVARAFKAHAASEIVAADACPGDAMILDAGPASVARFAEAFRAARTILWNGPLGAFELAPFDAATTAAARVAGELAASGRALVVAGGGDTVAALNHAAVAEQFSYVSTAGGAFLEWLEGKTLPGVAALMKAG
ncbi:MAG: phosphoglycerate kinase [Hyphomicrobiaceae bacterium]|nr:phosphoglycerate kinase [Hyphomicrobiaceae bacterium]